MEISLPRRGLLLLGLAMLLAWPQTAAAQIGSYPYGYGGWGGYPYDTGATYRTAMTNVSQQRMQGQQQAAAQRAALQGSIRSTLTNQATAWNQASQNRQQQSQDWWWQVQQQQLAERQARQAYRPAPAAPAAAPAFEPAATSAAMIAERPPANDIIQWRPILYDRRFDALRAEVEAPYLRNGGKPLSQPTAADYRTMIKAFEQMKVVLRQMDSEISAREYLDTCQDIDGLIKQAGDRAARLEAAQPKPAPAAK
jgi:hypothetical protein